MANDDWDPRKETQTDRSSEPTRNSPQAPSAEGAQSPSGIPQPPTLSQSPSGPGSSTASSTSDGIAQDAHPAGPTRLRLVLRRVVDLLFMLPLPFAPSEAALIAVTIGIAIFARWRFRQMPQYRGLLFIWLVVAWLTAAFLKIQVFNDWNGLSLSELSFPLLAYYAGPGIVGITLGLITGRRRVPALGDHVSGPYIQGVVRNLQMRSEGIPKFSTVQQWQGASSFQVWNFRLERLDADGQRLEPISVQMRGARIDGMLQDGDDVNVSVPRSWQEGELLEATEVENLTAQCVVAVEGSPFR
jgi:hypothetical protein